MNWVHLSTVPTEVLEPVTMPNRGTHDPLLLRARAAPEPQGTRRQLNIPPTVSRCSRGREQTVINAIYTIHTIPSQ